MLSTHSKVCIRSETYDSGSIAHLLGVPLVISFPKAFRPTLTVSLLLKLDTGMRWPKKVLSFASLLRIICSSLTGTVHSL